MTPGHDTPPGAAQREGHQPGSGSRGNWLSNPHLLLIVRLVLAAIFIYAAFQKIGKPAAFADEMKTYGILDMGPPLYIMAIVLPWLELICGVALVSGIFLRGSVLVLLVLNVVFITAVSIRTAEVIKAESISFFDVYYDCGCGFGATYAWKKLLENTVFLILCVVLLLAPSYRFVLGYSRRSE